MDFNPCENPAVSRQHGFQKFPAEKPSVSRQETIGFSAGNFCIKASDFGAEGWTEPQMAKKYMLYGWSDLVMARNRSVRYPSSVVPSGLSTRPLHNGWRSTAPCPMQEPREALPSLQGEGFLPCKRPSAERGVGSVMSVIFYQRRRDCEEGTAKKRLRRRDSEEEAAKKRQRRRDSEEVTDLTPAPTLKEGRGWLRMNRSTAISLPRFPFAFRSTFRNFARILSFSLYKGSLGN